MLYLPLESDFIDRSGQSTARVFSTNSSYPLSYTTVGGVKSFHAGTYGGAKLTTPYPLQSDISKPLTVSIWIYLTSTANANILDMASTGYEWLNYTVRDSGYVVMPGEFASGDNMYTRLTYPVSVNQWMHTVYTVSSSATKFYINGQLQRSGNGGRYPRSYWNRSWDNQQGVFTNRTPGYRNPSLNGNARELIIEQIERSENDVANYYNWSKQQLGL